MSNIDKRMDEILARGHGYRSPGAIPLVNQSFPMISRLDAYRKDAAGKLELDQNGRPIRIDDPDDCPESAQHDYTGEIFTKVIVWKFSNRVRSWNGQKRYECFVRLYIPNECQILLPERLAEIAGSDPRIAAYLNGNEYDARDRKEGSPFLLSEAMQKAGTPAMEAWRPPYQLPEGKSTWFADIPMALILEAYARHNQLVYIPRHWSHLAKLVANQTNELDKDGDLVTTTKIQHLIIACSPVHRRNEPVMQPGYVLVLDKKFAKNVLDAYDIVYEDGALPFFDRWSTPIDLTSEPARSPKNRLAPAAKPKRTDAAPAAPEKTGEAKREPEPTPATLTPAEQPTGAPANDVQPPPPTTAGSGTDTGDQAPPA